MLSLISKVVLEQRGGPATHLSVLKEWLTSIHSPLGFCGSASTIEDIPPSKDTDSGCVTQLSDELKGLDTEHQQGVRVTATALLKQDTVLG